MDLRDYAPDSLAFETKTRRAGRVPVEHEGKVIHDWMPTGRIDFAGPSMDASAADTPAHFTCKPRMFVSLLVSAELSARSFDGEGRR